MEFKGNRVARRNPMQKTNYIVESECGKVISYYTNSNFDTEEEMIANAKLDAAAPELLKVVQKVKSLEDLIRYPSDVDFEYKEEAEAVHQLLNEVDAAIEKALK